jgi:serine/threonine protein kinase
MTKLGKYEILEEIGRGGFAVVYKARDTSLDRVVALKVLHPQLTIDPKFVQRFHQEAQAAARLHHPHIVTIHEVGEEAGQHYLAMTFLPGRALDERLAVTKGPLPVELAISIAEQIADALNTIHQQGLVHRDVKPANIMVDNKGQATLLDFGIVRAAEGTRLTTTMAILGTPEYMAPEQADPTDVQEIDWRADIYALGVVAYEMLVGRPPFTGKSPTKVLYQHVHEPPPAPTALNPDLPVGLESILLQALAKQREKRFRHAGDFVGELRRALLADGRIKAQPARQEPLYEQLLVANTQTETPSVPVQSTSEKPVSRSRPRPTKAGAEVSITRAGFKAGWIGAVVLGILAFSNLIPLEEGGALSMILGWACLGGELLACVGIGVLAGIYLPPPRDVKTGAYAGAIAGAFSGIAASIMTVVTTAISPLSSMVGFLADQDFGTNWVELVLTGGLCCLSWIGIGVVLGALGGLISAVIKSD